MRPAEPQAAGRVTAAVDTEEVGASGLSAERRRLSVRRGSVGLRGAAFLPSWVWVLLAYTALAVVTLGRYAVLHPRTICSCVGTEDPAAYMWALSWWPHALVHGLNPFVSHELWSPTGVNVAQAAMIPTAAIVMAPITELAGPVFAYNVLSIASPVLAAMSAYLLCRRIVGRELPAVIGGYLFGFSAYELAQLQGHLNLTLVFLMPLFVLLALRRVHGELSRARYLSATACLIVLQVGLSSELLADAVAVGAFSLAAAYVMCETRWRRSITRLASETVVAGLIAILIASPFLYYALFSGVFPKGAPNLADAYGLDLLNPIFPTVSTWLGSKTFFSLSNTFMSGHITEEGGYLSLPLLLGFMLWALRDARASALSRLLLGVVVVTFVVALGSHLHVAGQETLELPFNWVHGLPIADNILPARFFLFTALAVAIGLSSWLALGTRGGTSRWAMVLLGVVLILPNLTRPLYGGRPHNPALFASSAYRKYLRSGETVLALPFGANDVSMLWQAESGFYFRMPEGYVSGVIPSAFAAQPTVLALVANRPPPAPQLGAFIREHAVSHVVVDPARAGPWPSILAQLGLKGHSVGGTILYAVPPEASARVIR